MPDRTKSRKSKRNQTKDRVLQARIPEQLDEELRNRAEQLGLSVSTVVRNVLLHTFDLVEGVVTDSSQIARVLSDWVAAPSNPEAEATVVGWQEAILNKNGVCEHCNVILPVGQRAAIGVPTSARATLLCLECLAALSSTADDTAKADKAAKPAKSSKPKAAKKRPAKTTSSGRKKTDG
jgi:hypothetical protein